MARATRKKAADPLARYNEKRDFARTSEPAGKVEARRKGNSVFVVQKHEASRLHWDFRLEIDGVLTSWAVTRGPSLNPADKRLAVRTEDHPMAYADFEGTIPANQYGGGTVMLWDRGTWTPVAGKSVDTLEEGHLHFTLAGERMQGEWILIRLPPKPGERQENWLLKKVDDAFSGDSDTLVGRGLTSITTGRTMDEIAAGVKPAPAKKAATAKQPARAEKPAKARRKAARAVKPLSLPTPPFHPPQLATPSARLPEGGDWLFEVKYDGYRALIATGKDGSFGWSRSGLDWSDRFAPVVRAAEALPAGSALIDGEIVALDAAGRPSFSALQQALKIANGPLLFFAFDLLHLDGEDLTRLPLRERKARLEALLEGASPPLHYSEHIAGDGRPLFDAMAQGGYEGVIAKRADRPYAGTRSGDWLKIKVDRREEFVIVGHIPSDKRGRRFSSLLLAQYEGEQLVYRGKVGTGFDDTTAELIAARLKPVKKPPVVNPDLEATSGNPRSRAAAKPVWARGTMVAEVRYAEYTADNVLRHASFIGLRDDKPVHEVVSEMSQKRDSKPGGAGSGWTAPEPSVAISNAGREIFGERGPTKGDLASWYEAVAPYALPWMAERPLALLRCPSGVSGQCFFQKHLKEGWGDAVDSILIEEKDGTSEPTFLIHDKTGLLQCAQMGTIEVHGWGAGAGDVEHPDRLVFDLDPDEGLGFGDVKRAAKQIRDHLADMGLVTFPMLTGGKGVHVIAPLTPKPGWDAVEDFAKRFAIALEQAQPDRYTASMSKARRKGRIFIDWMRNRRGSTAILPWSVRARTTAGISAPLGWAELDDAGRADLYTLYDPEAAFAHAQRPGGGWGEAVQTLPDA